MKINQTSGLKDLDRKSAKAGILKRASSRPFTTALAQKENEYNDYKREVDELKQEINEAGDKLEREPNLLNFHRFRDLLGQIAKKISAEAYRLNKIGGTPQNPRYYEIITVISLEADQLYKLLLDEQRNRIAITEKVIGIKGLVVDLTT
jgi:uncharacterized protein